MLGERRSPGSRMRTKQYGTEAIDDESSNAGKDPDAATEAIPEGQARAELPADVQLGESVVGV